MSCAWLVVPPPHVSLSRLYRLASGVLMDVVVVIVYGWPTELHFLRDISNVCQWLLWWRCRRWIHTLMPLWLWCPLLLGMPLQDGFLTAVYSTVGVSIGVASLDKSVSQASSRSRSFPRSIAASLKFTYSSGASVMPKGNLRQRKDSSSTIAMHVDAVFAIACIRQ